MSTSAKAKKAAAQMAGEATTKRYGTLIRVSNEFSDALKDAAGFERASVAKFADAVLLPIVREHYRNAILRAAKELETPIGAAEATSTSPARRSRPRAGGGR